MAGTKLVTAAVLLLLSWSTHQANAQSPLTVSITINRTDPPGFTPRDSTEYRAASGPHVITCTATGGSGEGPNYQWSSDCRHCPFQEEFEGSTFMEIRRAAVGSNDNGTHTCTASRGEESANDSIVFNIVGAGIHFSIGTGPTGSQPNNGLTRPLDTIATNARRMRFFCRSDSTMLGVGALIGLDGTTITSSSLFDIYNSNRGEVDVNNRVGSQDDLTANEQGVYTCRIPLESGEMREINIGIYPDTFFSVPTIINPLVFTPGSSSSTLTCTSSTSVATTVTFTRDDTTVGPLRDGESMEFGGVTYQLTQLVTDRSLSTYENVLTINQPLADAVGSAFTCQVENVLGPSETSQPVITANPGAGTSADNVTIVGGVLGALVALLLVYGVVATIVIVVLMHRNRRGQVSINQPVDAGTEQPVKWSAMTNLGDTDIKTSECVAYGQAQPPSTDRAQDTEYELIRRENQ